MSEGSNGMKKLIEFFKKPNKDSQEEHDRLSPSTYLPHRYKSQILDHIYEIAEISLSNNTCDDIEIADYLKLLTRRNLIHFGENVCESMAACTDFNFEFFHHATEDNHDQVYCIISHERTMQILAVMQVTEKAEQVERLDLLLYKDLKYERDCGGVTVVELNYDHICGLILSYVKSIISKLEVLDDGFVYIMSAYPNEYIAVDIENWMRDAVGYTKE